MAATSLNPYNFTSIQIPEGHIYMIGGIISDLVCRNCWEIDPNLIVEEKEPMKVGRFNIPLALVKDRFIFAIGGMIGKNKPCEIVEAYDVNTNNWYTGPPTEKPRSFTSACVLNQR